MITDNLATGTYNVAEQQLLTFITNSCPAPQDPVPSYPFSRSTPASVAFDPSAAPDIAANNALHPADPSVATQITSFFWEEKNTLVYQLEAHIHCTVSATKHQPGHYEFQIQDGAQAGPPRVFSNEPQGLKSQQPEYIDFDEDVSHSQMNGFNSIGAFARVIPLCRRNDNNFVNGTKLLNIAEMSRGKRDSILKNEKERDVVKSGSMRLKGVWIPLERAFDLALSCGILNRVIPLFDASPQLYMANNMRSQMNANLENRISGREASHPSTTFAKKNQKDFDAPGPPIAPMHNYAQKYHLQSAMPSHLLQPPTHMIKHQLRSINDMQGLRSRFSAHSATHSQQIHDNQNELNSGYFHSKSDSLPYALGRSQNSPSVLNYQGPISSPSYLRPDFAQNQQINRKMPSSTCAAVTNNSNLTPATTPSVFSYSKDELLLPQLNQASMFYPPGYAPGRSALHSQVSIDEKNYGSYATDKAGLPGNYSSGISKGSLFSTNSSQPPFKNEQSEFLPAIRSGPGLTYRSESSLNSNLNSMSGLPNYMRPASMTQWSSTVSQNPQGFLPNFQQALATPLINIQRKTASTMPGMPPTYQKYVPPHGLCRPITNGLQHFSEVQYAAKKNDNSFQRRSSQAPEFQFRDPTANQEAEHSRYSPQSVAHAESVTHQEWMGKTIERSSSTVAGMSNASSQDSSIQSTCQEVSTDGSTAPSYAAGNLSSQSRENYEHRDVQNNLSWGQMVMAGQFSHSDGHAFPSINSQMPPTGLMKSSGGENASKDNKNDYSISNNSTLLGSMNGFELYNRQS